MSIQLIVYPQSYKGSFNAISNTSTEFIADGINFGTINTSNSSKNLSGLLPQSYISSNTFIVNTWYRFSDTSNEVTESAQTLIGVTDTYFLQALSNLSVGTTYDLSLNFVLNATGVIVYHFNGNVLQSSTTIPAGTGISTIQFNATSSNNDIIVVKNLGAIILQDISVTQSSQQPSGNITNLGVGQVICDLYENEDIPLSLSVDDFKNAAEQVQSYSKAFTLPGTKRNNKIFDNLFEITRSDDGVIFNPYIKTQCKLKQDGFILFEGYLRMIDIQEKQGEISYNVNLYSEVIALADVLQDRKFRDLDFDELAHNYTKTTIKNSWDNNTGLPLITPLSTSSFAYDATIGVNNTNVLKYPFVDWTGQIAISNGSSGTAGYPQLTSLEQVFRPFINLKYLIQKIFADTPFTFTSEFFDSDEFTNLYMDFNWGSPENPPSELFTGVFFNTTNFATTSYSNLKIDSFAAILVYNVPSNYNTTTNILTATTDNENYAINYAYKFENTDSSSHTIECQWLKNSTQIVYSGIITIPANSDWSWYGNMSVTLDTGDTLQAQFKADAGSVITQKQTTNILTQGFGAYVTFTTNPTTLTSNTLLQNLRGDLGQWEFLKGIITMFNLVTVPDKNNPNHILIEPYNDIFLENSDSKQLNWTDKIDVEEIKLEPLSDLNKNTIFKFVEDDDDYAFQIYKNSTGGHLYGSKKFDASAFDILEGEKEIIPEPFAATIVKPLFEQFNDLVVPAIFTSNDEATEFEGFDNSPRIMYNNGQKTLQGGVTYYIPAQNGLSSENQPDFLQFSNFKHIPAVPNSDDYHFGECQTIGNIGSTSKNLFNLYWLPYFSELYNADTRTMTIKVNLTPGDISTFRFYDTVIIKNREFRVNKIDYKPNDLATIEFILI